MSHFIQLREAQAHTFRYQRSMIGSAQTHSVIFDAQMIDQLTSQEGAREIRIYMGEDEEGRFTFVLVGVDGDGNDLLPGLILNQGKTSPPVPAGDSPLNL